MNVPLISILFVAGVLVSCGQREPSDPIDRVLNRIEKESKTITFTSYPYSPIKLSSNASPNEVIAELTNRGDFDASNVVVTDVRKVRRQPGIIASTAVLVNSSAGQKVVLIEPLSASNWFFRIYEVK